MVLQSSQPAPAGDFPVSSDAPGPDPRLNTPAKVTQHATPALRRANTVAQGGNTRDMGSNAARDRFAASLLRPKDSHELLSKVSLKRSNTHQPRDALAAPREPKHFTVSNVGQNGKIFLRPIRNLSRKGFLPPSVSSSDHHSPGRSQSRVHGQFENDPSRWSNSQLSELRPGLIPEEAGDDGDSLAFGSAPLEYPYRRPRPHSFSTISERQSLTDSTRTGEFRIVIDRSENRPKSADAPSHPELEVPIPHYRLGTPLFNAAGSAALHSSIYTSTSFSDNRHTPSFLRDDIDASRSSPYVAGSLPPGRPSFAASMFSKAAAADLSKGSAATENSVVYEFKEPVVPAIFEALGSDMDDESVVRYIPSTKDIGAATPARIVAQISSEAFMDYELVSDFFLTFRSYLSTSNLLALLLARLEWAINRLEDDGRIIRIRTFAALRHWILNYFVDDFAADHDLRVRFCQTINAMYDHVKAREGGGMSDLKIIIDLKRCWQGKCSLFSRSLDLVSAYHNPHAAILPGDPPLGEDGADDNNRRAQNILQPNLPTSATAAEATNIGENTAGQHDRSDSAATAKTVPISSQSDQSFQASSCMLRPKSPKHASMPFAYNKGPRPVPLTPTDQPTGVKEPNPVSPIISKHHHLHGHTHKRSGSFSDSVRDERAPLSLLDQQNDPRAQDAMNIGALVRGELYPPSESCMTMMAPPSPPLLASDRPSSRDRQGPSDSNTKPGPANLGVKTIIGSIRRAFVPRNGGPTISSRTAGPSLAGKTSAVPNNIAVGSGFYRDRKMAALSKRPPRIDILCDKVLKQYQEAIGHSYAREHAQQAPDGFRSQGPLGELDAETATRSLAVPGQTGGKSQVTGGSESIVIVDDTGMEMPVMTGAEGEPLVTLEQAPSFLNIEDPTATPGTVSLHAPSQKSSLTVDDYSLPIYYDHASSPAQSRPTSSILDASVPRRTLSGSRGAASRMRTSLSHGLRKYASFQSGMSRYRASMGSEAAPTPAGLKASLLNHDRPTGPILRRRPGGDLRKMQGGGLEAHLTPGSFASDYSFRSSMPDRTATPPDNRRTRPETCLIPPNPQLLPMRNSAQNAGRSFEDAIARFAEIPDDDDGGIESTLLKLEGKWQDSSPESGSNTELEERQHVAYGDGGQKEQRYLHHLQHSPGEIRPISDRRHQHRVSEDFAYSQVRGRLVPPRPYSDSIAESEESYNSIPLLERGLSDDSMKKPQLSRVIPTPAPRSRLGGIPSVDTSDLESSHPSIDVVKKTDSVEGVPPGSTIPTPKASRNMPESFSGMSSDMSVDVIDRHEAMERQSMDTNSLGESMFGIPPHPLAHPPSPPMTIQNPRSMISCGTPSKPVLPPAPPLTPDPSPRNKALERGHIRSIDMQQISNDVLSRSEAERDGNHGNGPELDHVPFILSCESHVLAQQLTLVEMAALNEVDWRDLVEMRWSTSLPSTVSWVQFLFEEKRRGIDLVGGRFNLMVKWVLSEIVLTQDLHDRVRTITKFIHTAVHAKRLGNYATMSQITIALSSTNCSRLERTWGLVPQEEKNAFRSMESLIQPVRNFHDLRVEMETVNLQEGCIPFVGLYVHDLTYNAQKPAQIINSRGEPLVNFERYRTTARIAKNLLRLIDASTKYNIEPVQGIIERCVWIASLSEEEIQRRSRRLY